MNAQTREKLVKRVVRQETNDVVGGYENSILDGHIEEMPSLQDLIEEVHSAVMRTDRVEAGGGWIPVKKDIRFLGNKRILELVTIAVTKSLQE